MQTIALATCQAIDRSEVRLGIPSTTTSTFSAEKVPDPNPSLPRSPLDVAPATKRRRPAQGLVIGNLKAKGRKLAGPAQRTNSLDNQRGF